MEDEVQKQDDDNQRTTYTYKFVLDNSGIMESEKIKIGKEQSKIWQILPSICGSMMCIPYGMMLGWPSPTYPLLLAANAPIAINLDQSAAIAGFLMIGVTLSTPLSSSRLIEAKYGICLGVALMTIGWIIMWQAANIYCLFASRIIVGIGFGYGSGQLKCYITEICEIELARRLIKSLQVFTLIGVIITFAIGPFVAFSKMGIISVIISIFIFFLAIFLPSTPRELVKNDKISEAKRLIVFLNRADNSAEEVLKIRQKIAYPDKLYSFTDVIRDQHLRLGIFKLFLLVFFQQWVGFPATVVYSQIIFTQAHLKEPHFCALGYIIIFFIAHIYGLIAPLRLRKKYYLYISSLGVSLILFAQVMVLYYKINQELCEYIFLLIMILYVVIYTVGFGNMPVMMIEDLFPKEAVEIASQFYIMTHCMLALIITKIFQVLYAQMGFITPFCLFFIICVSSNIFIVLFLPK